MLFQIVFDLISNYLIPALYQALGVIKLWWWAILPFVLVRPFLFLWRWWRSEMWYAQQRFIMLEVKMPKEILKPIKAMEQVFASLWGNVYDPPDWWEKWVEGKNLLSLSFEIVSIDGNPHFFIRVPAKSRNAIESALYAQYSDLEILEADDYTKYVPLDIPNKEWEMWGCDYALTKEDVYPIRTYAEFFEESPQVAKEEKRIDPLSTLLEGIIKLGPGEQLWVQITAVPITNAENDYISRGKVLVDKLVKRPKKTKPKSLIREAAERGGGEFAEIFRGAAQVLVTGQPPTHPEAEGKTRAELPLWPEMMLSPGERDIVQGVEAKIGKYAFECNIRFIYLARREHYDGAVKTIPFGFFQQFSTANLNAPKPWAETITKIHKQWFLPLNLIHTRRLYIRKRQLFKKYIRRVTPLFPRAGGTFVLNIEELATIFHFPGRTVAPASLVTRIEAKKGAAPPGLPIE